MIPASGPGVDTARGRRGQPRVGFGEGRQTDSRLLRVPFRDMVSACGSAIAQRRPERVGGCALRSTRRRRYLR
jgi:hypothetical protein